MMYVTDRRDLCSISCPRLDHHHHHQYHHHNHHYHHHHHPHHHLPHIVHILWQLHCTGSSWSIWIWSASKCPASSHQLAGLLDPINWPPPPLIASVQNTEYFKTLNTSKQLGYTQISACSSNQTEFWIQSSSVCNCFKILWLLLLWEYTHC